MLVASDMALYGRLAAGYLSKPLAKNKIMRGWLESTANGVAAHRT